VDSEGNPVKVLVDVDGRVQVYVGDETQSWLELLLAEMQLKADQDETQPVSAASLPLPTDAATQTTLAALLTELQAKADLEETQPVSIATMPTTTVQAGGGDKIFGLEAIYEEQIASDALAAGVNNINGTAVPDGKIYVITHASLRYVGTSPTFILGYVSGLAVSQVLFQEYAPTSGKWFCGMCNVLMQAGDYAVLQVSGATAEDDAELHLSGYAMDAPS